MSDITTKLRDGIADLVRQEAAREIDRLREANRYLVCISNEAMEDARKYAEAKGEIASLRAALDRLLCATEGYDVCPYAKAEARYVLAQAAEVGNG